MKKLLRPKDILFLTLAGVGDTFEELRDPLQVMGSAYKSMYGFIPRRYKRSNFVQAVHRSLRTGDIEKVAKDGQVYLRLTSAGKESIQRDFPLLQLSKMWNRKWVIVLFDVEEKSRVVRDRLREKLRHLGFGMLQQSVWITPLPIGKEMIEFIESNGLAKDAFVLEVSHLLLGDPKALARNVWHLDGLEEKCLELENEIRETNQLVEKTYGRRKKRQGKLHEELRKLRKKRLELLLSLPFFVKELLPEALGSLF